MKNFLASLLGSLAALILFSLGLCVLFFGFIGLIAAMNRGDKAPALERGAGLLQPSAERLGLLCGGAAGRSHGIAHRGRRRLRRGARA